MRQICTELGKSSWCGAHLAETEKMGWQLVLCVPRTVQEQCLGVRVLAREWKALGDAALLHPLVARSEHWLQGRGWWKDAVVRLVCWEGVCPLCIHPILYKPADDAILQQGAVRCKQLLPLI